MDRKLLLRVGAGIFVIVLVIGGIYLLTSTDDSGPIVKISNGMIQGKKMNSFKSREFFAFMGIPFAKPPTGDLRFQPPQQPDNWRGILNDQNSNKMCPQLASKLLPVETEDCLYLSVYTPELPTDSKNVSLPVMVVIHGGAFMAESGNIDEFGPQYLIDYEIVMVAIQYRLGMFGFLSTDDLNCPGNNGLKDQQLALRWVQNNVHKFGGDPKKVTIFGESAGGASVGYQILGSHNENLFRGAIQQSGSPLNPWALQRNARDVAYRFGNYINSEISDKNSTSELIAFLRTLSIEQIKKASVDLIGESLADNIYKLRLGFTFAPVLEIEHEGSFITQGSFDKFHSDNYSKVPMLMGVNSEEAIFIEFGQKFKEEAKDFDMNRQELVSPGMNIADNAVKTTIANTLRELYTASGDFENNLGAFVKFFSDETFVRGVMKQAELQSRNSQVFFYEFAYRRQASRSHSPIYPIPGTDTVCHGDEMTLFFHRKGVADASTYPKQDFKIMKAVQTMWTNFIKYQNPTPDALQMDDTLVWKQLDPNQFNYLLINETLEMKTHLKQETYGGYDRIYKTYAIPPHTTF